MFSSYATTTLKGMAQKQIISLSFIERPWVCVLFIGFVILGTASSTGLQLRSSVYSSGFALYCISCDRSIVENQ